MCFVRIFFFIKVKKNERRFCVLYAGKTIATGPTGAYNRDTWSALEIERVSITVFYFSSIGLLLDNANCSFIFFPLSHSL